MQLSMIKVSNLYSSIFENVYIELVSFNVFSLATYYHVILF